MYQLELFVKHLNQNQMSERERKKAIEILKDIVENLKGLEEEFRELKEDRVYFERLLRRVENNEDI